MAFRFSSIFALVLYVLLFPLYIYGFMKWYQWRHHAFFRLRYSYPDGLIVVAFTITLTHLNLTHMLLDDIGIIHWEQRADNISNILLQLAWAISYIIFGLIFYRTHLIFQTCKQYQARLYQMGIALDSDSTTIKTFTVSSPRTHCISQSLLVLAFGGGILHLIISLSPLYGLQLLLWPIDYVILITLVLVVKCCKAKELLGCLYEMYWLFVLIAVWWVLLLLFPEAESMRITYAFCDHMYSLIQIYFALYFVYKSEGTLKRSVNNQQFMVSIHKSNMSPTETITVNDNEEIKTEAAVDAPDKGLIDCLSNQSKYEELSQYLAFCFSLENLMFVERICVLRWCIMDKIEMEKNQISPYSLKFIFLQNMYKEYNKALMDDEFIMNRNSLWSICHDIYEDFICNEGKNQINIPFEVKHYLDLRLKTTDDIDTHFKSYDDFLLLFRTAIENSWYLLQTIYDFKFLSYMNQVR